MYLQDATFPGTVAIPVSSGSSLLTFALKLLHKLIITVPVPYDAAEGTDATTTTATTATTRVIRVGNASVLPQDASAPQPHFPMIVQAGNVIQVVPADNTQVLGAEVVGVGRVMQVVGVPGFPPTPAPDPCPSHPSPCDPCPVIPHPLLPPCGAASGGDGRWRWATHTWVSCGLAYLPPQQQIPRINEDMVDPEIAAAEREREKQERRERKERRRREREARREARQRERERKRLILLQQQLQQQQQLVSEEGEGPSSDAEDEVLFREAMSEVPVVGSPVPEYEVEEEKEEEDEEEARIRKKKRLLPVALPPADKGILRSPSYRFVRCKELAQEASEAV
ncbi:hypothetical protein O3P69_020303 [Scylla paramamosain]|uniref:Uncharacterized protein n=3 Tax=Scylla paramamosain TaxID=85552 RepID=A0AAW0SIT0_SCYPA